MAKKRLRYRSISIEDEDSIWEFIHKSVVEEKRFKKASKRLFEAYVEESKCVWDASKLTAYYNEHMQNSLYKSRIPAAKMLALYKQLRITIFQHEELLLESTFKVVLRIDKYRLLHSYHFVGMNNDNVVDDDDDEEEEIEDDIPASIDPFLETGDSQPSGSNQQIVWLDDLQFSPKLESKMWNFAVGKVKEVPIKSFMTEEFWKSFQDENPLICTPPKILVIYFNKMLFSLHEKDVEIETKLEIMKTLMVPLDADTNKRFLKHHGILVRVDERNVPISWKLQSKTPVARKSKSLNNEPSTSYKRVEIENIKDSPKDLNEFLPNQDENVGKSPGVKTRSKSEVVTPVRPIVEINEHKRHVYNEIETKAMWDFVWKMLFDMETGKPSENELSAKSDLFWEVYKDGVMTNKSISSLCSHFRKKMIPNLLKAPLERIQILWIYKLLNIAIDEKLQILIQNTFNVELRLSENRLLSWKYENEAETVDTNVMQQNKENVEANISETVPTNEENFQVESETVMTEDSNGVPVVDMRCEESDQSVGNENAVETVDIDEEEEAAVSHSPVIIEEVNDEEAHHLPRHEDKCEILKLIERVDEIKQSKQRSKKIEHVTLMFQVAKMIAASHVPDKTTALLLMDDVMKDTKDPEDALKTAKRLIRCEDMTERKSELLNKGRCLLVKEIHDVPRFEDDFTSLIDRCLSECFNSSWNEISFISIVARSKPKIQEAVKAIC